MLSQSIKIGQREYVPTYAAYTQKDVVDEISDKMGGFVRDITIDQFNLCERMIKDGWVLLNCFFGEKDKYNKNHSWLNARPNWFRFTGIDKSIPQEELDRGTVLDGELIKEFVTDYVVYINFNSYIIFLYDNTTVNPSLSGTFHSYDDLLRALKHIQRCIPAKQRARIVLNNGSKESGDKYTETEAKELFGDTYYIVDFDRLVEVDI